MIFAIPQVTASFLILLDSTIRIKIFFFMRHGSLPFYITFRAMMILLRKSLTLMLRRYYILLLLSLLRRMNNMDLKVLKCALQPEDWDDEEDGEWTAPTIPNPEYKGPWKQKVWWFLQLHSSWQQFIFWFLTACFASFARKSRTRTTRVNGRHLWLTTQVYFPELVGPSICLLSGYWVNSVESNLCASQISRMIHTFMHLTAWSTLALSCGRLVFDSRIFLSCSERVGCSYLLFRKISELVMPIFLCTG